MKDQLLNTPVQNRTQRKRIIIRSGRSIAQDVINSVWKNFENRLDAIIRENGGHVERF